MISQIGRGGAVIRLSDASLELERVYGYRGNDVRGNICAGCNGSILYNVISIRCQRVLCLSPPNFFGVPFAASLLNARTGV